MKNKKTAFALIIIFFITSLGFSQNTDSNLIDVFVILDNSSSMKQNDPNFMTKSAVKTFLNELPDNANVGLIIFDEDVKFFSSPVIKKDKESSGIFEKSLLKLDYSGEYTNIPKALEKAFYELKERSRPGSDKIIVFFTDGIIVTPESSSDENKKTWVKDILTQDCKQRGIRIYSIAFTENADYELIQTLGVKTNGGYYKALNASEISSVFKSIKDDIINFRKKETPQSDKKTNEEFNNNENLSAKSGINILLVVIIAFAGIIILISLIYLFRNKSKKINEQEFYLPEAFLIDVNGISNKPRLDIKKRVTRIGRDETNDICIPDENKYISSLHAIIEFKDNVFYIEDSDSVNGVSVNGVRLKKKEKVQIKGGDEIKLDKYEFKFMCPSTGERGQTVIHTGGMTSGTVQHLDVDIEIDNNTSDSKSSEETK